MSILIKIGAAGVIGFAATSGASAQTLAVAMDQSNFLAIAEAPLDMSELSEARGGFKIAGFDFKFGVSIAPVVIAPLNLFPDGVFDDDAFDGGVFDDDFEVFDEDGVFGPGGVFGQNGPPSNGKGVVIGESAVGSESVSAGSKPVPSLQASVIYTPPAVAEAPETQSAQTTPVVANVDSSLQSTAAVSEPLSTVEPTPPSYTVSAHDVEKSETYTASQPTWKFSGEDMEKFETYTSYEKVVAEGKAAAQSVISRGLHLILNNTQNNVEITRIINLTLDVGGYDANITRSIGNTVTATIASSYGLLLRF